MAKKKSRSKSKPAKSKGGKLSKGFKERKLSEEDTVEEPLNLANKHSKKSRRYIDDLFDDIDVDLDDEKDTDGRGRSGK
jgi:hypothetical protein